jgi:hypothetical protein
MPRKKVDPERVICQFKVTLRGSKPPIWRRVQAPGDITLGALHTVLQLVMAWDGYHLHQFVVGDTFYSDPAMMDDLDTLDEDTTMLRQVAPREGMKIFYEYDFGDSWEHELLVEKYLPAAPDQPYPVCLTGRRASPPEDCGGVWGYAALLDALADPKHPDYEHWREWVGDDFDPAAFDLAAINARLRQLNAERGTGH